METCQTPPGALRLEARRAELAELLGRAIVRLYAQTKVKPSAPVGLAIPPRRSVYGLTNPSPQGEQP